MSLKTFHFVFIVLAILLSIGCSLIGWSAYRTAPEPSALWFGIGFAFLSALLAVYGVWYLKKSKQIIL